MTLLTYDLRWQWWHTVTSDTYDTHWLPAIADHLPSLQKCLHFHLSKKICVSTHKMHESNISIIYLLKQLGWRRNLFGSVHKCRCLVTRHVLCSHSTSVNIWFVRGAVARNTCQVPVKHLCDPGQCLISCLPLRSVQTMRTTEFSDPLWRACYAHSECYSRLWILSKSIVINVRGLSSYELVSFRNEVPGTVFVMEDLV